MGTTKFINGCVLGGGVIAALAILARVISQSSGKAEECFSGAAKYCISAQHVSGKVDLPTRTDYWLGEHRLDEEGLPYVLGQKGQRYRNPSSIANVIYDRTVTDVPELCKRFNDTELSRRALAWIVAHQHPIGDNAVGWLHDYDTQIDDVLLKAPWPSAFSHAAIVERLLVAGCATGNREYLDLARRAGRALAISVREGGLRSEAPDFVWFQEVPLPDRHNPHIVNAHLYSILILQYLGRFFPGEGFHSLAARGLESLVQVLDVIDTGSWNRYELRPRYSAANFAVYAAGAVLAEVRLQQGRSTSAMNFVSGKRRPTGNAYWSETLSLVQGQGLLSPETIFLELTLPRGRTFNADMMKEDVSLSLSFACCGQTVQAGALGIRPGQTEYFNLPEVSRERERKGEVVSFALGLNDFSWGQVGPEYIIFDAELLAQIALISGRPDLYLRSLRWWGFSRRWEERSDHALWRNRWTFTPDPDLADHLWTHLNRRRPSEISEAEIASAIDGLYPAGKSASCDRSDLICEKRARARVTLSIDPA